MDIICIGQACKDIFFPTADGKIMDTPDDLTAQKKIAFELGAKFNVEKRFESLGGCAANVAVGLARLGLGPFCYSHIGDDLASRWIIDQLKNNNVDAKLITQGENCPSDLSAIVVDKKSGERIIFSNQVANAGLEILPQNLTGTDWIFIGDLHGNWQKDLDIIFEAAKKNNSKVAYNPRQSNIHDNVKFIIGKISGCEVIFLNKDEAIEIISGLGEKMDEKELDSEVFLVQKLNSLGAKVAIVTDGLRGAWTGNGEKIIHAEALKTPAKDTTGAGDAFASGFLAAYVKNKGLEECLQWGIANSANSVEFYGGVEGLLGGNEIVKMIDKIEIKKINY